jgi:hypothetical protein
VSASVGGVPAQAGDHRGGNSYSAISRAADWTLSGSCHLVPPASHRATEISSILAKLGAIVSPDFSFAPVPERPTMTLVVYECLGCRPGNMTFDRCEPDAPGP